MTRPVEHLREKDKTVLQHIEKGDRDIQQITSATTLENHEVNYCFTKLSDLDLITVEKPEGMVERIIDGQKRVFEAPKQAQLTESGQHLLTQQLDECTDKYRDLSHEELVQQVHQLQEQVNQLQSSLRTFKQQVQRKL